MPSYEDQPDFHRVIPGSPPPPDSEQYNAEQQRALDALMEQARDLRSQLDAKRAETPDERAAVHVGDPVAVAYRRWQRIADNPADTFDAFVRAWQDRGRYEDTLRAAVDAPDELTDIQQAEWRGYRLAELHYLKQIADLGREKQARIDLYQSERDGAIEVIHRLRAEKQQLEEALEPGNAE